jgi:hypothetical protein
MWDMLDGGFPLDPVLVEMGAMGMSPPRPPQMAASRMEALRELWTGSGLEAVETREITVRRTFADFDDFLGNQPEKSRAGAEDHRAAAQRGRHAQATGARAPASR